MSSLSINGMGSSGGLVLNDNSMSGTGGYSSASNARGEFINLNTRRPVKNSDQHNAAPSASDGFGDASNATTIATTDTWWTTTSSVATKSSALLAGFNANAYGTPPHLRRSSAALSIRSEAVTSSGGEVAKVRASDVSISLKPSPDTTELMSCRSPAIARRRLVRSRPSRRTPRTMTTSASHRTTAMMIRALPLSSYVSSGIRGNRGGVLHGE